MFTAAEKIACRRLIELALDEDLGTDTVGDWTSRAIVPLSLCGTARFVARAPGVLAGLAAAELVLLAVDKSISFRENIDDGTRLTKPGTILATATGPMHSLLIAERIALNFLQHLSGIATLTQTYVDAVAGLPCVILDTRKTTPGWRILEKYAVRCGGGVNHRFGLYDGLLVKDSHLHALGGGLPVIRKAIESLRRRLGSGPLLEIEVENLEQLYTALTCPPDIVLLDNMSLADLRQAVELRNTLAPNVKLEASGGVTLANVRAIAETGVDRISVGALTHSAPALDIALDFINE